MKSSGPIHRIADAIQSLLSNPFALVAISIASSASAFAVANMNLEFDTKLKIFASILVAYLIYCSVSFVAREEPGNWLSKQEQLSDDEIEQRLVSLEEAAMYFGGSLKPADMFRLMASRIKEIVRFDTIVMLSVDHIEQRFRVVHADGENADSMRNVEFGVRVGSAGKAYDRRTIDIVRGQVTTDETYFAASVANFRSAAAIPLMRSGEVFAVIQLFSRSHSAFDAPALEHLEAISERVAPMVMSSLSLERSVSSALTDPVTQLPNERAFFMILEYQLAETLRRREGRPLSVLAIDIKYFNDVNEKFGHTAGNAMLNFVAGKLKDHLRQMDFFSRSSNDEFLVILPTATSTMVEEIIERVKSEFADISFSVSPSESMTIDLNFGGATFGADADTSSLMLAVARERKEQSKTVAPGNVVWFPREYLN